MRVAEWLIVAFLAYLLAILPARRLPRLRRGVLLVLVPLLIGVVVAAASWPASPASETARRWLPMPFILACYWLTGLYFVDPQPDVEARFLAFDQRVWRWLGVGRLARRAPRFLLEYLELAYVACYVVLPAGVAFLFLAGYAQHVDRFSALVVLAELACFGVLPWIQARPPWALQPATYHGDRTLLTRRFNMLLVRHASTTATTFPSGHAAGALAAALAVGAASPTAGAVFFVIAASIAAGSVFGRYHYAGDAITGAAVALAAWGVLRLLGV